MDTKSISTTQSNSPVVTSTPGTPPDTEEVPQKEQLRKLLEKQHAEDAACRKREAIIAASTERIEPMTFGQKRFWFLTHYVDDPTTFNIAYLGQLSGKLRVEDLSKATEIATQRHESLRTRFFWHNDENKTPMQGILSKTLITLEVVNITSEAQAIQELDDMRKHIWDFGQWVPLRLRLLSLSETEHYILIGTHHISMDGHSFPVLMLDIHEIYNKPGRRLPRIPDTSQARAFGAHQRLAYESGQFKAAIEHYRSVFAGADFTRPIELFPFSRTQVRPPLDRYGTHVARMHLDSSLTAKLKKLAQGRRSTSFHAYLAALQVLLFRLLPKDTTEQVCIGIADANRIDKRFMGTIANLLNVLPLKMARKPGQTFGSAIETARDTVHSALQHSALPFDLLLDELGVPRSNAWAPVFQVFMNYRLVIREHAERQWVGTELVDEKWHPALSGYDVAVEIMEDHEGALLAVHVQKSLYDQEGAELLARGYVALLKEVTRRGERVSVERLPKWDEGDVKKAIEIGKGVPMTLEWPATVAHRIDDMIAQHPSSIAIRDDYGCKLTYAEMDVRVNSIAHAIRTRIPESSEQPIIGVFQMPSVDWICSLVAINRVGAIYLPLDLRVGIPRLRSNVEAGRPSMLLVHDEALGQVGLVDVSGTITIVNVSNLPSHPDEKEITTAQAHQPAYIIFTSGSTGEPKGIVVTHAGLRANLEGYHGAWNIASVAGVVLQQAAFSFDASILMIYAALTTGGSLLVVPAHARGDPAEVTRMMVEHGVTMTQATPSEYDMWFRFAPENLRRCTSWKAAWFGGERAGPGLLDSWRQLCKSLPNLRIFTSYGPTETTISAMKGEVDIWDPKLKVPIPGRLLPNYTAYIVDDNMNPVPIGVPGEIMIGGAGIDANEYLNSPEQTAEAYPPDPFSPGHRMYRTGDHGRLDSRGYLTIEGRIAGDTQCKLRGFRIELTEIERVMAREGGLDQVVVTLRDDSFLAAFVVFKPEKQTQSSELIAKLRARLPLCLPPYMCPSFIIALKEMPLTAHAKIDRKAVQAMALPEIKPSTALEGASGLTDTERRLAALWTDLLPVHAISEPLGPRSDFFAAGGNSLLLVQLQGAMKKAFGGAPRLSMLMGVSELGSMAALLDDGITAIDWDKEISLDFLARNSKTVLESRSTTNHGGFRILVTGGTGSLGRHIVSRLVRDERIAKVICLVRPNSSKNLAGIFPQLDKSDEAKVHLLECDLPALPKDSTIGDIDLVIHCAADRSFWDGYAAAKIVNVESVKALTNLCLRSGASLHVLSSGAVAAYEGDDEEQKLPRPSPEDGYVASKWVAERLLSKAAMQVGLSVTAHRPSSVRNKDVVEGKEAEEKMARVMLDLSRALGSRPEFARIGGTIDMVQVEEIADDIAASVLNDLVSKIEPTTPTEMKVVTHLAKFRFLTEVLGTWTEKLLAKEEFEAVRSLPAVPVLHWVGLAKKARIFEWLFTAMDLVVTDQDGKSIISRR